MTLSNNSEIKKRWFRNFLYAIKISTLLSSNIQDYNPLKWILSQINHAIPDYPWPSGNFVLQILGQSERSFYCTSEITNKRACFVQCAARRKAGNRFFYCVALRNNFWKPSFLTFSRTNISLVWTFRFAFLQVLRSVANECYSELEYTYCSAWILQTNRRVARLPVLVRLEWDEWRKASFSFILWFLLKTLLDLTNTTTKELLKYYLTYFRFMP